MGSITIQDVRKAGPYARAYNWHIEFPSYGGGAMFPCHTVNIEPYVFENDEVAYGPWDFHYPRKVSFGSLGVEVYEISDYRIFNWIKDWANDVVDKDNFTVGLLADVARQVNFHLLNLQQEPSKTFHLFVIPDGPVSYSFGSDKNGLLSVGLSFSVVGYAD